MTETQTASQIRNCVQAALHVGGGRCACGWTGTDASPAPKTADLASLVGTQVATRIGRRLVTGKLIQTGGEFAILENNRNRLVTVTTARPANAETDLPRNAPAVGSVILDKADNAIHTVASFIWTGFGPAVVTSTGLQINLRSVKAA